MDTVNIAAIIIRSSTGTFFAHQRSATKKVFPNLYGLGAGGHIQRGEAPQAAARRELFEETGLHAEPAFLFSFPFENADGPYQVHVFEVISDAPITPDAHEWQLSGWFSLDDIHALSNAGKLMPDTQLFFSRYLNERTGEL